MTGQMAIEPDEIGVNDLAEAKTYYCGVFGAEISEAAATTACAMKIGLSDYQVVLRKAAANEDAPHFAVVPDVDVSIARAITRGGRVVAHAGPTETGCREGRIIDPFGNLWVVSDA